MTEQEIEKLREKLGSEYSVKRLNGAITVELADIWNGVEFYENHLGIVKPISESFRRKIKCGVKFLINPSTESAYVEQLKAKAKELYGEIKDGDRFDCYMLDPSFIDHELSIVTRENDDFEYIKEWDRLYKSGVTIYQQGKWAKKVEEPIRVEFVSSSQGPAGGKIIAWFQFEVSKDANIHSSGIHLAKCLEDYLNKS